MSRQQKRANDRKQNKTALQKICLAAGEGVSRAVAFSFALVSNAFAAEPKKEEPINLPPVVVQEQNSPYVVPQSSLPKFAVPLQDTPQAVIVVPDKLIQEQGGTTLRDALRNVSGISITASEAGGSQETASRCAASTRAMTCSSTVSAIKDPIFATSSISSPSKLSRDPLPAISVAAPPAASSTR